jgi:hypothetical protein
MRVFTSDDFAGHWPVGTAAVVVAPDEAAARVLLLAELATHGLADQPRGFTLRELDTVVPAAVVLNNGDY